LPGKERFCFKMIKAASGMFRNLILFLGHNKMKIIVPVKAER